MTIQYPHLAILFFLVLILWIYQSQKTKAYMSSFGGNARDYGGRSFSEIGRRRMLWKKLLYTWGLIFIVLATIGIQVGSKVKPVERKGVDLVFMLDVSQSMDAEDINPSRLQKSKIEISQIIRNLKGDRVAIIVFAGSSHLYLPLTLDYEAAELFLDAIDTKMIPTQGTSLLSAINTGINSFTGKDEKHKVMILISDGEDHEGEAVRTARKAAELGMTIHTVGVGTVSGSLIPVTGSDEKNREYKKDRQGRLVTSVLNEQILLDIADAGNGVYVKFNNRSTGYRDLIKAIDQMDKKTIETHIFSEYENRYQIPVAIALALLSGEFIMPTRRKKSRWERRTA